MKKIVSGDTLKFFNDAGSAGAEMQEEKTDDHVWLVRLKGSMGNECAYDIADEMFALASAGNGIILDMNDTTHVSESFCKELVKLEIKMEKTDFESLPIQNMPREIYHAFEERGYHTLFEIEMKEE